MMCINVYRLRSALGEINISLDTIKRELISKNPNFKWEGQTPLEEVISRLEKSAKTLTEEIKLVESGQPLTLRIYESNL